MSEQDNDKLLDHEYDGIQELDNNLPLWWLWTFFGAIIFSFLYWIHYSLNGGGLSLDQELAAQMDQIEDQRKAPSQNQAGGEISDTERLAQGKKLFIANCASCHKENGGGSIGPNLTDAYWVHGNSSESIKKVVIEGILDKGMPPWGNILRPAEVESVVLFVESLKNTNVSDGKEAQGEMVK